METVSQFIGGEPNLSKLLDFCEFQLGKNRDKMLRLFTNRPHSREAWEAFEKWSAWAEDRDEKRKS